MQRENLEFGHGSFIGDVVADPEFFNLPEREQARIIGWANSCPVVEELSDPDNPNPGRGPEAMVMRYAEVNFWFGFIARETERLNPALHRKLMQPVNRQPYELVGKHEPESVPESHAAQISPMGTLAGYALPRIFVEQLGTSRPIKREEIKSRMVRGVSILERIIPDARTPNELLALVSEELALADVPPIDVLKHVLSSGWLKEHNAQRMLNDFKVNMRMNAPALWHFYSNLSEVEKAQNNLA